MLNLNKQNEMIWLIDEDYKLPLYLPDKNELTKEEFFQFCMANDHLRIERDEYNQIYIMAPVGGNTGRKHIQVVIALEMWNKKNNAGITFDSSTGFELPDGSMKSPDAAWITKDKWDKLTIEQREEFLPFAPDFAVELLSPSDKLKTAQEKMYKWIQNGTQLGWVIVPKKQQLFIYRSDGTVDKIEGFDKKLSGENVLPGFEFDLSILV